MDINWLAVLAAALAPFALGFLWYGPLFGRAWGRAAGVTPEMSKAANMGRIFGLTFVAQLVQAVALAMFLGPDVTLAFAIQAGFMTGAFFVATGLGVLYLFELRPLTHWAVNAGYVTVAFTAMGAVLGAWA